MIKVITCRCCKRSFDIEVDGIGYMAWNIGGKLIQEALPLNTPAERELLISGTCEECFNYMFGGEEDV